MANILLSEAEKTFILHGVEVFQFTYFLFFYYNFFKLVGRLSRRRSESSRLSSNGIGNWHC